MRVRWEGQCEFAFWCGLSGMSGSGSGGASCDHVGEPEAAPHPEACLDHGAPRHSSGVFLGVGQAPRSRLALYLGMPPTPWPPSPVLPFPFQAPACCAPCVVGLGDPRGVGQPSLRGVSAWPRLLRLSCGAAPRAGIALAWLSRPTSLTSASPSSRSTSGSARCPLPRASPTPPAPAFTSSVPCPLFSGSLPIARTVPDVPAFLISCYPLACWVTRASLPISGHISGCFAGHLRSRTSPSGRCCGYGL